MVARAPVILVHPADPLRRRLVQALHAAGLACEVHGEPRAFLAAYDHTQPGCLVLDTDLPDLDGLALQAQLRSRELASPVIFVSSSADAATAIRALRHGAIDYLLKPVPPQTLVARVREALALDERNRYLHHLRAELRQRVETLTAREREVMRHVVAGELNRDTAALLGVTSKAIEAYRGRVMRKMAAASLPDLVRMNLLLTAGYAEDGRGAHCWTLKPEQFAQLLKSHSARVDAPAGLAPRLPHGPAPAASPAAQPRPASGFDARYGDGA
jgi:two-component system, LuxR family, response regulator FixJ